VDPTGAWLGWAKPVKNWALDAWRGQWEWLKSRDWNGIVEWVKEQLFGADVGVLTVSAGYTLGTSILIGVIAAAICKAIHDLL
jgi:hypothetical protein